ncbi:glycerate kinase [Pediococcus siamensis]|uniref:glycerate kinase n=1 Tax=Pediococcus siamensis TaxID=381829 RepID=UPI00399FAF7F
MKIIVAPDSFKNSMSAQTAAETIIKGIRAENKTIECVTLPMADGGEGTMSVIMAHLGGEIHTVKVADPLGREITAEFGLTANHQIAVMDMASASGIELLKPSELNVFEASTFGTGQLIQACLAYHPSKIYIGIGGSATVDGGVGMAQALGFQFLDAKGATIKPGNRGLAAVEKILQPDFSFPEITVLNDVNNPLLGQKGAANIFGPQKGAGPADINILEHNLSRLASVVVRARGQNFANDWGTGGAGGLSFGLKAFLNASLVSGIEMLLEITNFANLCRNADFVITGEGSFDAQSLAGKVPFGIIQASELANPKCGVGILAGKVAKNLPRLPDNVKWVKSINEWALPGQQGTEYGVENGCRAGMWVATQF